MNLNENMKDLLTRGFIHGKEVRALSALLAGEISAVEAYNVAIENVKDVQLISTLEASRNSHALRVATLQERIEILGEDPLESSGWWGAVARFVEHSATLISDRVAMSVLAAGEDYGFGQYEQNMTDLDADSFSVAENELLPAQGRTLQTILLLCALLRSEAHKTESGKANDDEHGTRPAA
jgi:hypothetical protein